MSGRSAIESVLIGLLTGLGVIVGLGWGNKLLATDAPSQPFILSPHVQGIPGQTALIGERGLLIVPEVREKAGSPHIAVAFLRFPSTAEHPGPPIFWLPGGPGDSEVKRFVTGDADPRFLRETLMMLSDMRSAGDVVILDQRGAGLSQPYLVCPNALERTREVHRHDPAQIFKEEKHRARQCQTALTETGYDTAGYNIEALADDVNDLRAALGYKRIILFGGSFGSQWSLAVMRRHGRHIERALLRGIEDTPNTFDDPAALLAALEAIAADAEADPDLADQRPVGGFIKAITERIQELEAQPVLVPVMDDKSGESVEVIFGAEELRATWWRDPDGWRLGERLGTGTWPGSLLKVLAGDYSDLAAMILADRQRVPVSMSWPTAQYISVDCSLAGPPEIYAMLTARPATAIIGNPNISLAGACAGWDTAPPDPAFFTSIQSSIPVLMVHGSFDMATPLPNAQKALEGLETGHLITVHRSGHNPLTDLYREQPDVIRPIIRRFLQSGSFEDMPEKIALPPIDYLGPQTP